MTSGKGGIEKQGTPAASWQTVRMDKYILFSRQDAKHAKIPIPLAFLASWREQTSSIGTSQSC